jgi:hypothetical protein
VEEHVCGVLRSPKTGGAAMIKKTGLLLLLVSSVALAKDPPVIKTADGNYQISAGQGIMSARSNAGKVLEKIYKQAQKHCETVGKSEMLLVSNTCTEPKVAWNQRTTSSCDVVFRCD